MDLAIVTDRWDPAGGGRERYPAELRASLARRGRSVELIVKDGIGEKRLQREVDDYRGSHPSAPVMASRPLPGATHYQLHSGVYASADAAEREAYDSALRRLCFWPALRLNATRSRLLRFEERLLAGATGPALMAFSTRTRDEVQRAFGTAGVRVILARPGIDLHVFRPHDSSKEELEFRPSQCAPRRPVRLLFAGHNFVAAALFSDPCESRRLLLATVGHWRRMVTSLARRRRTI